MDSGQDESGHRDLARTADDEVLCTVSCAHPTLVGRQVASASMVAPSSARWRTPATLTPATS